METDALIRDLEEVQEVLEAGRQDGSTKALRGTSKTAEGKIKQIIAEVERVNDD